MVKKTANSVVLDETETTYDIETVSDHVVHMDVLKCLVTRIEEIPSSSITGKKRTADSSGTTSTMQCSFTLYGSSGIDMFTMVQQTFNSPI